MVAQNATPGCRSQPRVAGRDGLRRIGDRDGRWPAALHSGPGARRRELRHHQDRRSAPPDHPARPRGDRGRRGPRRRAHPDHGEPRGHPDRPARLGLIHQVAALVSAPGLSVKKLRHEVKAALTGSAASLITLRPQHAPPPVATSHVPSGRPTSYIQLFQESAAQYCPGLPWTVLAAIGQIESGDRANPGVSSAGALGPMQFLPSTWAEWGITAFGEPGPPNIYDPFDAVPSAARYLCAAGGATAAGLPRAIFAYNHANWHVTEGLRLAQEDEQAYG